MSRATRLGSALAGLVLATGMLGGAPAAHAATVDVIVNDSVFSPGVLEAVAGDEVVFARAPGVQLNHTVTSEQPDLFHHEFGTTGPGQFPFTFDTPDTYAYYCKYHGGPGGVGMSGVIEVAAAPTTTTSAPTTTTTATSTTTTTSAPSTTTTSAPSTTTTSSPPATTTTTPRATTTRPSTTTSTTRPPTTTAPTTATTVARGSVSGAAGPTTTTAPKKKSTTTTKSKKKKKSTTTTKPKVEETTTTVAGLPSLAAAAPPPGAPELPAPAGDIPDATETGEEAASWVGREEGGSGGGHGKKLMFGLGGLGALSLAGGGWRWYNRSSRYLPA